MHTFNRRNALGLLASATGAATAAPALAKSEKKKIGVMYIGQPEGSAWNYEHFRGIEQVRAVYGDRVQVDDFFGVKEWGQGDGAKMRELVGQGYDMIICTAFGYMKSTFETALAAPNVLFEHCGGFVRANNMATYLIRWSEGRVVEGVLAGSLTKTNRIGYVASHPVPQVFRGINAAFLAARQVNPEVEFDITWLNSWYNPELEDQAARKLIERGADVIMQHTDSPSPVKVAEELGAYTFGQATDMKEHGPKSVLTSLINNWGPYYVRRVGAMLDGTWETKDTWGGLAEEMLAMGPISDNIPSRVHLQATDAIERLRDGRRKPFVGAIRKQDGSGWLAPGEVASDSELHTMNFFVDGLTTVVPTK